MKSCVDVLHSRFTFTMQFTWPCLRCSTQQRYTLCHVTGGRSSAAVPQDQPSSISTCFACPQACSGLIVAGQHSHPTSWSDQFPDVLFPPRLQALLHHTVAHAFIGLMHAAISAAFLDAVLAAVLQVELTSAPGSCTTALNLLCDMYTALHDGFTIICA